MDTNPLAMTEEALDAAILSETKPVVDTEEAVDTETPVQEASEEEAVIEEAAETEEVEQETEVENEQEEEADVEESTEEVEEEEVDTVEDTEETDDSKEIDFKSEYEKIFTPFQANGKKIAVTSAEEAIQLMQMGANYSKKMSALKPSLKIMKTLEKNGLLDQTKLNLLIDVSKNKPGAIAKLLKEADIDPLDLDVSDKSTEYVPETYTTTDSEVELEDVLSNIRETASYSETIDIVSNKWDAASKQVLINTPSMIEVINEHVANGTYAKIAEVMDRDRLLGNLKGMSDLEAYRYVGTKLHEQAASKATARKVVTKPASKKTVDPSLRNRKKEAALNTGAVKPKAEATFNPLSLSAEELDKIDPSKY